LFTVTRFCQAAEKKRVKGTIKKRKGEKHGGQRRDDKGGRAGGRSGAERSWAMGTEADGE